MQHAVALFPGVLKIGVQNLLLLIPRQTSQQKIRRPDIQSNSACSFALAWSFLPRKRIKHEGMDFLLTLYNGFV
jgi:hypothetical protein